MKISIFGMGYVGVVTAACFAKEGHDVIGVDIARNKVDLLNDGVSPIVEDGLGSLVTAVVRGGALKATTDHRRAVMETDVSLVSVSTPSLPTGALDLRALDAVTGQIAEVLRDKQGRHTVIIRSTVLPGTTRGTVIPRLEAASGKRCGDGFGVCYNPEFLREGTSIADFYAAPFTILGEADCVASGIGAELYGCVPAPIHRCSLEVAEAAKYVSNAFHAVKVGFANEIGVTLKALGVDSHAVMRLVCLDTKLNISPAYLRPGFAFGGSCLPKDLRALLFAARQHDVDVPVLNQLLPSNQLHVERAVRMVLETGERDVALLGLSFKPGTDYFRESPLVLLAERLIGKGVRLRIYDPDVVLARLTGANREYINREIPHIGELLTDDFEAALATARVAIVGNDRLLDFAALGRWAERGIVIDSLRLPGELAAAARSYQGICW